MKVLLDECVDRRLGRDLTGHTVKTVPEMGWAGRRNGDLLALAAPLFDAFVTVDRNLEKQQKLSAHDLRIVVLRAASNRVEDLRKVVPALLMALPQARIGAATIVE